MDTWGIIGYTSQTRAPLWFNRTFTKGVEKQSRQMIMAQYPQKGTLRKLVCWNSLNNEIWNILPFLISWNMLANKITFVFLWLFSTYVWNGFSFKVFVIDVSSSSLKAFILEQLLGMKNDWKIWIYENSSIFANCWMSGLVGPMITFGPPKFIVKDLFLDALGPSSAAHTFGAATGKNSCGVLGI